jgi:hypothetical protein
MNVQSVEVVQGIGKDGRSWTRYDATLDNGVKASGFEPVAAGETVEVVQKGKYLNFVKAGSARPPVVGKTWTRPPDTTDNRSNRIERQHSQDMALMYATLKKMDAITSDELRKLINWFQRDISRSPVEEEVREPEPPPTPAEGEDYREEF